MSIGKCIEINHNLTKEGSAYDSKGLMLDDKMLSSEGSGTMYHYMAYVSALKALYIDGEFYYEK